MSAIVPNVWHPVEEWHLNSTGGMLIDIVAKRWDAAGDKFVWCRFPKCEWNDHCQWMLSWDKPLVREGWRPIYFMHVVIPKS